MAEPNQTAQVAFAAQVDRLVSRGYPALVGTDEDEFRSTLSELSGRLTTTTATRPDAEAGVLPFVIVMTVETAPTGARLELVRRRDKQAIEMLYPREPDYFQPIDSVQVPGIDAYLLLGVERGDEYLDVTPDDALTRIEVRGRTPLTIDEGVALLTHYPEFLQRNRCFSLLGSRGDDRRVPALWLSDGSPKLGWCWAGNPHTWLGSASCAGRSAGVRLRSHARVW